jgi:hypothetical protein
MEFVPGADVSAEADLWFSSLIESRGRDSVVLDRNVSALLRQSLSEEQPLLQRVLGATAEVHSYLPHAIRLEEKVNGLALIGGDAAADEINIALQPALRAIRESDRRALEIARWFLRAAPAMHPKVLRTENALALLLNAALRLHRRRIIGETPRSTARLENLAWILPSSATGELTTVGVELVANGIRFVEPGKSGHSIELPRTQPLLLELRWSVDDRSEQMLVEPIVGSNVALVDGIEVITIYTLAGAEYRLARSRPRASRYGYPGVYVEEVPTELRRIAGVATATAGIVGAAERGPEAPLLVTSWAEFQRWYGGYVPDVSYLAYAIHGFFENQGRRCFVSRIVARDAVATSGVLGNLRVAAIGRGVWGNNIQIKVDGGTHNDAAAGRDWFRVSVLYFRDPPEPADFVDPTSTDPSDLADPNRREPDLLEIHDNLTEVEGTENNVVTVLNAASCLIRVAWDGKPVRLPNNRGFVYLGNDGEDSVSGSHLRVDDFTGDRDAIPGSPASGEDLLGRGRGLVAMETIDEIGLLLAPDEVRSSPENLSGLTSEVIAACERLGDRFAILSMDRGQDDVEAISRRPDTSYAAIFYPWIEVADNEGSGTHLVPPAGHIAGVIARTDLRQGVHKAPGNEEVRGVVGLEFPIDDQLQNELVPLGVNCIRDFRSDNRGIRLWGARTLSSNSELKYLNVRRLSLFVVKSIEKGIQWTVFEPNDEATWASIRLSINEFLSGLWRSGALNGSSQDEAFFVNCDRTSMTQEDIDEGRLICHIGIAPIEPARFLTFKITHHTGGQGERHESEDIAEAKRGDSRYAGFNFLLEIGGIEVAGFSECSGLGVDTSSDKDVEGGGSLPVGGTVETRKSPDIRLKRGYTESKELLAWWQEVPAGRIDRRAGAIVLLDETGKERMRWKFRNAWPSKWVGPLSGSDNEGFAVEELELIVESLELEQ